jgi:hypothetical protein
MYLQQEAQRATELLQGKEIEVVLRPRLNEVVLQFSDGTRLIIDAFAKGVELSITGGSE